MCFLANDIELFSTIIDKIRELNSKSKIRRFRCTNYGILYNYRKNI